MPKLSDMIKNALDEARILVLGTQVLIGAELRMAFEPGFTRLSTRAQQASLSGLVLLLVAFALIVTPGAYHRIVERGEDSPHVHRVITTLMAIALLPFASGLGIGVAVSVHVVAPGWAAVASGVGASAVALLFWYGIEALARDRRKEASLGDGGKTELNQRIVQVLTEARVAIPGAQALLGFQFVIMLAEKFPSLPALTRWVHVAALLCSALSVVLFMTPAAYHRLVEKGENSEEFHRLAGQFLLAALVPLALAMCGDLYVVMRAATERELPSVAASVGMLLVFFGLWFGWTLAVRTARQARLGRPRAHPASV